MRTGIRAPLATDDCSPRIEVFYGTRRSTTLSLTTRIESSSTHLNSKTAWLLCRSQTRRRQRRSRRRWTIARRMPTRTRRISHSALLQELAEWPQMGRAGVMATVCWEDSLDTATRRSLVRRRNPLFRPPTSLHPRKAAIPMLLVREALRSIPPTHHGSLY